MPDLVKHAQRLAQTLATRHFPENTSWRVSNDPMTVIDQIDNMTVGMAERIEALEAVAKAARRLTGLDANSREFWATLDVMGKTIARLDAQKDKTDD